MRSAILIVILTFSVATLAAPLDFQGWKEQQILTAQNQVLRLSAQVSEIKSGKPVHTEKKKGAQAPVLSDRIKKTGGDPLILAENNLLRAQESLQAANNLTLDDYITVYLPSLQSQPDQVDQLASKLTKAQLAKLFTAMTKRLGSDSDGSQRHQASALEGMALTNAPTGL